MRKQNGQEQENEFGRHLDDVGFGSVFFFSYPGDASGTIHCMVVVCEAFYIIYRRRLLVHVGCASARH